MNQGASAPIIEFLQAKSTSLGDQTYERLRELILSRRIPGGTELPEGRLAERLNVSRTPMREALVRLVGEGLLERAADRAYRVRAVSAREFFECMQVRELLECYAVEKSIPLVRAEELLALRQELLALSSAHENDMAHWRYDNKFHTFFAKVSGNETMAQSITQMRVVARLFRISSVLHRQSENDDEHLAILDAVTRGDVEAAKSAMRAHLCNLQDDVRRAISAETDPSRTLR